MSNEPPSVANIICQYRWSWVLFAHRIWTKDSNGDSFGCLHLVSTYIYKKIFWPSWVDVIQTAKGEKAWDQAFSRHFSGNTWEIPRWRWRGFCLLSHILSPSGVISNHFSPNGMGPSTLKEEVIKIHENEATQKLLGRCLCSDWTLALRRTQFITQQLNCAWSRRRQIFGSNTQSALNKQCITQSDRHCPGQNRRVCVRVCDVCAAQQTMDSDLNQRNLFILMGSFHVWVCLFCSDLTSIAQRL